MVAPGHITLDIGNDFAKLEEDIRYAARASRAAWAKQRKRGACARQVQQIQGLLIWRVERICRWYRLKEPDRQRMRHECTATHASTPTKSAQNPARAGETGRPLFTGRGGHRLRGQGVQRFVGPACRTRSGQLFQRIARPGYDAYSGSVGDRKLARVSEGLRRRCLRDLPESPGRSCRRSFRRPASLEHGIARCPRVAADELTRVFSNTRRQYQRRLPRRALSGSASPVGRFRRAIFLRRTVNRRCSASTDIRLGQSIVGSPACRGQRRLPDVSGSTGRYRGIQYLSGGLDAGRHLAASGGRGSGLARILGGGRSLCRGWHYSPGQRSSDSAGTSLGSHAQQRRHHRDCGSRRQYSGRQCREWRLRGPHQRPGPADFRD
jgi:hypothetical protein